MNGSSWWARTGRFSSGRFASTGRSTPPRVGRPPRCWSAAPYGLRSPSRGGYDLRRHHAAGTTCVAVAGRVRLPLAVARRVRLPLTITGRVRLPLAIARRVRLPLAIAGRVRLPLTITRRVRLPLAVARRVRLPLAIAGRVRLPLAITRRVRLPLTIARRVRLPLTIAGRVRLPLTITGRVRLPLAIARRVRLPLAVAGRVRLPLTITRRVRLPLTVTRRVRLPLTITRRVRLPLAIAGCVRLGAVALLIRLVVALRASAAASCRRRKRERDADRCEGATLGRSGCRATLDLPSLDPSGCPASGQSRLLTRNGHPALGGHFTKEVRRCPTLPQGPPCSTIGAVRLSFRVRNVTGRFPHAMAAETLLMFQSAQQIIVMRFSTVHREPLSGRKHLETVCYQVIGLLVPVSCTCCHASTSGLSTQ